MDHTLSRFALSHLGKKKNLVSDTHSIHFTLLRVECGVKKNFDDIKIF